MKLARGVFIVCSFSFLKSELIMLSDAKVKTLVTNSG